MEFCVTSTTRQGEWHKLIYSVSLKCAEGAQAAYSAAYALWCFTSGASLIYDRVGHGKEINCSIMCLRFFS